MKKKIVNEDGKELWSKEIKDATLHLQSTYTHTAVDKHHTNYQEQWRTAKNY